VVGRLGRYCLFVILLNSGVKVVNLGAGRFRHFRSGGKELFYLTWKPVFMDRLLDFLHSITPLSPELREYLQLNVHQETYKAKDIILRPGQVCRKMYFISNGLLRCYYAKDKTEITEWLMIDGDVATDLDSFYDQAASAKFIHAVEDTSVFFLWFQEFDFVTRNFPEINYIIWKLMVKYLQMWNDRTHHISLLPSKARYESFSRQYPELVKRVPAVHMATYLAMWPETYSRARS
jgi:hypothetical protein